MTTIPIEKMVLLVAVTVTTAAVTLGRVVTSVEYTYLPSGMISALVQLKARPAKL